MPEIKRQPYSIKAEIGLVLEAIAEEGERWGEGLVRRLVKLEVDLPEIKAGEKK